MHRNNFNLIRLFLAWIVIVAHSFELIDGSRVREPLTQWFHTYSLGEFAVNAFFLMSGYFITQSWINQPQWWPFLQKRLLRLAPGFFCAVVVSVFVLAPWCTTQYWADFPHGKFWPGLLVFQFNAPYSYDGWPYPHVNGPLWTLHYEYVCYWLVAALGGLGLLQAPRWVSVGFAGVLLAYLAVLFAQAHGYQPASDWGFRSWTLAGRYIRLTAFFMAGMCWFQLARRWQPDGRWALLAAVLLVVGLFNRYAAALVMTLPFAVLLHWAGFQCRQVLPRWQRLDLSYGLYLYAWPIQKVLLYAGVTHNPWVLIGLTTALGLLLAWASWCGIEAPALRWKPRPVA